MATELTFDSVREFIASHGGKVKNTLLVAHFRKFINDPANKDTARRQFKEHVNAVAAVRTEEGEKYVQLKRKFRTDQLQLATGGEETSVAPSTVDHINEITSTEQSVADSPKHSHMVAEASYIPSKMEAVPYADGTMETQNNTVDKLQEAPKMMEKHKVEDEGVFKKPATPPSQPRKGNKTAFIQQQLQQEPKIVEKQQMVVNKLPSRPSVQHSDSSNSRPTPSPTSRKREMLRSQKPRREISGPSDLVHITGTSLYDLGSIGIVKQSEPLSEKKRPLSVHLVQPSGAVERARQNFQNRKNEDTSSIAPSEKSVDSKEAEQDYDDDRTQPSFVMDTIDKQWMLRCAQCNMVEIRKMVNADPSLADKRDFFLGYTALHWAVKRGNIDLARMFCESGVDINARTNGGYTPLHLAAQQGHDKILQMLVEEFDCNTTLRDYSGHLARDYVKPGTISLPIQSRKVYRKRKKLVVSTTGTWRERGKNTYQIIDAISHIKTIPRGVFAIINDRTNNIVRRKKSSVNNSDGKHRHPPERRNSFTHDLAGQIGNWVSARSSFRRSKNKSSTKNRPGSSSSLNNVTIPIKDHQAQPNYASPPKTTSNALSWKPAGKKS